MAADSQRWSLEGPRWPLDGPRWSPTALDGTLTGPGGPRWPLDDPLTAPMAPNGKNQKILLKLMENLFILILINIESIYLKEVITEYRKTCLLFGSALITEKVFRLFGSALITKKVFRLFGSGLISFL
jgi:hypothetical protein